MSSPPQPGPGGVYQGGEYGGGAQPPGASPQQPAGSPQGPGFGPPQGPGFGQPPPPGQPPQPGGQFQVPGQFPPAGGQPEKKKRGKLYAVVGVVIAVGVAIVVRVVIGSVFGGVDTPAVGECVNNALNIDDLEVVDCSSAEATWEVIGVHGEMSESDFDQVIAGEVGDTCSAFPEWENALWFGETGGDGEVVCVVSAG